MKSAIAADRRAAFFLVAAAACFALVPLSEPGLRWVAVATGITYIVLAVGSGLDSWSRAQAAAEDDDEGEVGAGEAGE